MKKTDFQEFVRNLQAGERLRLRVRNHQIPFVADDFPPLSTCRFEKATPTAIFVKYDTAQKGYAAAGLPNQINFARIESIEQVENIF